ncbi:uncharacterized protein LOC131957395 [Physella acuta]|uniref:uncharacterized protein LOC131957395 n=1 Tax=Physella acuta TaxID=109671 RepID=UPI0027DCD2ED|nr:uncharacterized protein LOC131957395 [Physella acuta]
MSAASRARTSYDFYIDHGDVDLLTYSPAVRPITARPPSTSHGRRSRLRTRSASRGPGPREDEGTADVPTALTPQQPPDDDNPSTQQPVNDNNPYTQPMDPITRQYYYKLWRRSPPRPLIPVFREGRSGGAWRHIKSCYNGCGNHLAFIDGAVKSEENYFYPPAVMYEPLILPPPPVKQVPVTYRGGTRQQQERALSGYNYWSKQKNPVDCYDVWWSRGKV